VASYRGHLAVSIPLGGMMAVLGYGYEQFDWGLAGLAGGLTALGGLLPDLDSDSSVPVREVFGLVAAAVPFLLARWVRTLLETPEQALFVLASIYLLIRYGAAALFKRCTVHRGMFHSLPAMIIAGLLVYLAYRPASVLARAYLGCGTALGFLSHLVLDELYDVDFLGRRPHLRRHAGSPLKLASTSWSATLTAYLLLAALLVVALLA
jgi:membrane-bound metal-dependent hydrolase YbcI (DUF457 family)